MNEIEMFEQLQKYSFKVVLRASAKMFIWVFAGSLGTGFGFGLPALLIYYLWKMIN